MSAFEDYCSQCNVAKRLRCKIFSHLFIKYLPISLLVKQGVATGVYPQNQFK